MFSISAAVQACGPLNSVRNTRDASRKRIGAVSDFVPARTAEQNPSSFVIGTDLSAIQPDANLPNCAFVKDDAEAPWYFPDTNADHAHCHRPCEHFISFDYVHLRMMFTCFEDTRNVMRNAYANMNPGGWIEFQDGTFDMQQGNPDFKGRYFVVMWRPWLMFV